MTMSGLEDHLMCAYCRGEADGECTCPTRVISTAKLSIAELQRLRTTMTEGTWAVREAAILVIDRDHPTYDTRVMLAGAADVLTERGAINRRDAAANAAGTVALINAAPMLLEIVAAALTYWAAACTGEHCEHPAHRAPCALLVTQGVLETALAKVSA